MILILCKVCAGNTVPTLQPSFGSTFGGGTFNAKNTCFYPYTISEDYVYYGNYFSPLSMISIDGTSATSALANSMLPIYRDIEFNIENGLIVLQPGDSLQLVVTNIPTAGYNNTGGNPNYLFSAISGAVDCTVECLKSLPDIQQLQGRKRSLSNSLENRNVIARTEEIPEMFDIY